MIIIVTIVSIDLIFYIKLFKLSRQNGGVFLIKILMSQKALYTFN